jgi:hypothetical protein
MVLVDQRVVLDDWEAGELAVEYDDHEPQEVIRWALETFAPERVAVCTSFQLDGMAILDMAWRIDPRVRIFTVDTGRMPQETYELIDRVRERYGAEIEVSPKGRHDPCVGIRAVPIGEAMVACVIADHYLRHRGQVGEAVAWPFARPE